METDAKLIIWVRVRLYVDLCELINTVVPETGSQIAHNMQCQYVRFYI